MPVSRLTGSSELANSRRFRLALVLVILAVLGWFLVGALERQASKVERQSVGLVLSQLRAALVVKGAEIMLDRGARFESYVGINPVGLVQQNWNSFEGACTDDGPARGKWCFRPSPEVKGDTAKTGRLLYRPEHRIQIGQRVAEPGATLGWMVTTQFSDRNGDGRQDESERTTGLMLEPVTEN
ncbi:hypothetical protein ACFQGA_17640 [Marinobacter koreensis]|uniref:Uncharacterized protein n=1 Tax=Marinobacter koreensis TaxID=335974 RepID=A0ABW0RM00_9GAMM